MASIVSAMSHLTNPLATSIQLETSASQLDSVPKYLEDSIRFESARLIQAAGTLLRLPQDLVAHSIIIMYRFWVGPDGGSMVEYNSVRVSPVELIQEQDVAAAALYVTAKSSAHPVTPSQTLIAFHFLSQIRPHFADAAKSDFALDNAKWHLADGDLESARTKLYKIESLVLRKLGFQTHVALPYNLCINYMQTLDVPSSAEGSTVAKRAFAHLNTALLSPQLLYLTHQPSSIATAAIYLAAREVGVSLPQTEWWEVFDVDREDLGFLVVALKSVEGFAVEEKRRWAQRKVPLTVDELQVEIERLVMMENGE